MERSKRPSLYQGKPEEVDSNQVEQSTIEKGTHRIQVTFYGVLKEGVCINQETPANWLKVYPESELTFKGIQTKDFTLDSFPSPFIQTGDQKEQTNIVIPNSPDAAELEAAIKVYRTLKTKIAKKRSN